MKKEKIDDWFVPFEADDSVKLNAVTEKDDSSVKLSASENLKIQEDAGIKTEDV